MQDVADVAGISMAYLSEVERGRKEASSEMLAAAAGALGLGLVDLLALAQGELARAAHRRRPVSVTAVTAVTAVTSLGSTAAAGGARGGDGRGTVCLAA